MPTPSAACEPDLVGAFPLAPLGEGAAEGGIGVLEVVLAAPSFEYAGLVAEMLADALPGRHRLSHFATLEEALERLRWVDADCLLLDLGVNGAPGLVALGEVRAVDPQVPVVLLCGLDEERVGIESLQAGSQDYLVRGQTNSYVLARSIRYAVERKRAELELAHRAMHDVLTELPNRTLFEDRLGLALTRLERDGGQLAVMYVDLDRFKAVNARLGHEAGDRLICQTASRLRDAVRPADTVARFGSDDFMVLCEDVTSREVAERIAERIAHAISEPLVMEDERLELTASVGIAIARAGDGATAEDLVRGADEAMGQVKHRGGAGRQLFDEAVRSRSAHRARVERDLRRAIERRELRVHYQPQVDLDTGETVGLEALVRWEHPERGLLTAQEFVPFAEEIGLIDAIDAWVLREACRQLGDWSKRSRRVAVSVNLSARGLERALLVDEVAETISGSGVDPSLLSIEITESSALHRDDETLQRLHALKMLGVSVGLDDFGTGYASLSALSHFPLDILKIDRSFVTELSRDANKRRIVAATVSLAHALGLTPVAEGVERPEDLAELKALGCHRAQGHLFARAAAEVDPAQRFAVAA
jgi:diguanylate cyclase (GGDEF)-like protein